jgi:hypothetical protein
MIPRLTFLLIAAFWVSMNVLLWRAVYDSHGVGVRVPVALVWQKILTAPDISTLYVYQDGQRTGFCELSTSVEQEMATLDEGKPVPPGINTHAGYQVRFNGNTGLGDFTNRLTCNGLLEFSRQREWRKLELKVSSHFATVEIHSLADEHNVHLKITTDGVSTENVFAIDDLKKPNVIWRVFTANLGGPWAAGLDWPAVAETPGLPGQDMHWEAHLDHLAFRGEAVAVYRLETRVLDQPVVIYVSMVGELLRAELPDGVTAVFDQFGNP